jgi:hypothetical protein
LSFGVAEHASRRRKVTPRKPKYREGRLKRWDCNRIWSGGGQAAGEIVRDPSRAAYAQIA